MLKKFDIYHQHYKILKPYLRSFGVKIFIFIGAALLILIGISTWYNIHIQEKQLIEEALIGADNIAQAVKYSTRMYMLENKKEKVQETIHYITEKTEGIEQIRIFDKKGKIRKTTIDSERGQVVGKSAEQCLVCHMGDKPIELPSRERRIRIRPSANGNYRVATLIQAIYNEESCSATCHQYHPKTQRVLGVFELTMSLKDIDEKISLNRLRLIQFNTISFLLIMANLVAMLFYFLIRPVNALLNGVRNLSLGNFKAQIPVYSNDEFGRLSKFFNNLIEKLSKEIAYRNLLLYDNLPAGNLKPDEQEGETQGRHSQEGETQGRSSHEGEIQGRDSAETDSFGQHGLGSTFDEIYDRIKDETHMKLVRSVKLASLGQLSAGIAHEINNPLTAVLSYSSLLLEKAKTPKEKQWLTVIVDETKRCRNIVAGLLEFARQSTPEKVTTQVNDIIERAISLLENKESFHNIEIVKNLATDLPKVKVDRGQIYQVFTNLLINAADAMAGKGRLKVESRIHTIESKVANDRHFVEVSVTDTGCGIPEQNMERIFDPFFTTKGPTVGTGLGLSICFGIIKRHNGSISVRSKVSEGSTFIIHLPIEKEASA